MNDNPKEINQADILVVDDNPENLRLLVSLLGKQGYKVRPAANGPRALEVVRTAPSDLILLDIKMSEMDGYEVCRRLKADEKTRGVPVVFISALDDVTEKVKGFNVGGVDYITKPFEESEILARVETHLTLRKTQQQLEAQNVQLAKEITERKRSEEALQKAHDELEKRVEERTFELQRTNERLAMEVEARKQREIELKNGLQFERLIAEVSSEFNNLAADKLDWKINDALSWIGTFMNVERCFLFRFNWEKTEFRISHLWEAEGIQQDQVVRGVMVKELFPWLAENLLGGKDIVIPGVEELSDTEEARREYEYCRHIGIQSFLILPIQVVDSPLCAIGLDSIRSKRKWGKEEKSRLRIIGEVFANTIARKHAGEKLKVAELKYRTVADFTYDWEYWENSEGTLEYVSPSCERISGHTAQDFLDNPSLLSDIIVPEDKETWDNHHCKSHKELKSQGIQFRIQRQDGGIRWIEHVCRPIPDNQGSEQGFRASNRDITERKQAELELQGAYAEIKELKNQLEAESAYLQEEIRLEHNFENIIGQSQALKYVLYRVKQVATTDSSVLILGETGTGKELIARAIHKLSPRNKRALVKVNCAALPANLIESELFGHEKGAFTGATAKQLGRFEIANGSTLFLDEIGELPFELQAKLLRVLESGEFERLGNPKTLHSDARIIASTNRALEEDVRKGRFREDLWYRLKVFPITVPPLRQRREDIQLLVKWFVEQFSRKMGTPAAEISRYTMKALEDYQWPGNVRELKHAVEGALITASGKKLNFELPKRSDDTISDFKSLEEMERDYILRVLKAKNWKIQGENSAASVLRMNPNTLRARVEKLGLKRPS